MAVPSVITKRLPLLSLRVRGGWNESHIFQVIRGRQCVRIFSDYDKSAKAHLTPFQADFRSAVAAWQALPVEDKKAWQAQAVYLKRPYSGYHLFLSTFLKAAFA